jgi:hypothetical protein
VKVGLVSLAVALAATSAAAQGRWADPYRNGVKAFEAGKCGEAIPLLERAVAADPKAESNKRIEGVFRLDYFPYYYLALCYVEQQQWDKAAQNLDKARATLTRQQQARLAEAETRIKTASAPRVDPRRAAFDAAVAQVESSLSNKQFDQALRQLEGIRANYSSEYASAGLAAKRDEAARGRAGQLFDEARTLTVAQKYIEAKAKFQQADQVLPGQRPIAEALADIKRREDDYQQLKTQAAAEQNARNYSSARDKLEQARSRHPELFASDNLGARLTEVTTLATRSGGRGDNAGASTGGNSAGTAAGNTGGAANRGTAANTAAGNVAAGASTTAVADRRGAEVQRLSKTARDYLAQGRYAEAERDYSSVLTLDPKNQEASAAVAKSKKFRELKDRGTQLARANNNTGAQQALRDARALDPDRFNREGLAAIVDSLAAPPSAPAPDPVRTALQQGLVALLNGRAGESISILEPALAKGSNAASLHAYLGVAYATQALTAPQPEDRSRLQDKAVEQFKLAKTAQSDYQLSPRIVSPAILSIYNSARP